MLSSPAAALGVASQPMTNQAKTAAEDIAPELATLIATPCVAAIRGGAIPMESIGALCDEIAERLAAAFQQVGWHGTTNINNPDIPTGAGYLIGHLYQWPENPEDDGLRPVYALNLADGIKALDSPTV